jgi:HSP20 family molecular chaperone IbpA
MAENTSITTGKGEHTNAVNTSNANNGARVAARQEPALTPAVDVIEDASGITLFADLPGVPKDKLNLQLDTDNLIIEGEVAIDAPENMQSSHAEIKVPRYRRSFTLSKELDAENAAAEFNHGVLKLRIPKAAHAQPKKIQISVT